MAPTRLYLHFASAEAFAASFEGELRHGSLTVPGGAPEGGALFGECVVDVAVAGEATVEVTGWMTSIVPGAGVGVVIGGGATALAVLVRRLQAATQSPAPSPAGIKHTVLDAPQTVFARLDGMNVTEKMRLALSGGRDERAALLRDINKTLHVYVLRNPRIALDEVQWAARLTNLSPEALKLMADHPQWGLDPTTCAHVVRNPKTPTPIAIKLLDRISPSELRLIAKGGARQPIVQAARKKVGP